MDMPKPKRSQIKTAIYRALVAQRAFEQVQALSCFLLENHIDEQHPLFPSFMTAICVMYARPFTSNEFLGCISPKYGQFKDPALARTHDAVLKARNEFYAHTDGSQRIQGNDKQTDEPLHQLIVKVEYELTPQGPIIKYDMASNEMNLRAVHLLNIIRTCDEILSRLDEEQNTLKKTLFDERNRSGNYLPPGTHWLRLDNEG